MQKSYTKITLLFVAALFLCAALGFSLYRLYREIMVEKMISKKYTVDTIIQTGPEKEALPSVYLAEMMDLSVDRPNTFYTFDEKEAEAKLLKSPVIKRAQVKKIKPCFVYVDYEVYRPVALLGDFDNYGIDLEGNLFPIEPFFSPKTLFSITFGDLEQPTSLPKEKFSLALDVYLTLWKSGLLEEVKLLHIDLSALHHTSYGKRQIILTLQDRERLWYVRLTKERYPKEIDHLLTLKEALQRERRGDINKIIDLRIDQIAYVEDVKEHGSIYISPLDSGKSR